jgi:hypothetical protein
MDGYYRRMDGWMDGWMNKFRFVPSEIDMCGTSRGSRIDHRQLHAHPPQYGEADIRLHGLQILHKKAQIRRKTFSFSITSSQHMVSCRTARVWASEVHGNMDSRQLGRGASATIAYPHWPAAPSLGDVHSWTTQLTHCNQQKTGSGPRL